MRSVVMVFFLAIYVVVVVQTLRFRPRPLWYDEGKFGIFSKYDLSQILKVNDTFCLFVFVCSSLGDLQVSVIIMVLCRKGLQTYLEVYYKKIARV